MAPAPRNWRVSFKGTRKQITTVNSKRKDLSDQQRSRSDTHPVKPTAGLSDHRRQKRIRDGAEIVTVAGGKEDFRARGH